ncbi:MAG: amidohydrolase [Clostridiales Family XIII bacterium]|jgi:hippurate hydrolase|nr:amidohydrolase [Clostridiales Family XIII bacterium]
MNEQDLERQLIAWRRDLHRIPELDDNLPKTRAYLWGVLEGLGAELRDLGPAGFTAYFAGDGAETTAFRADMDALPISEETGCAFASTHPGQMHACGHDGHMAMLLGLAASRAAGCRPYSASQQNEQSLCRGGLQPPVLLIFQASEETTGGAKRICDTGVLRDYGVSRVYGLHLWPDRPLGEIVCRPKEFMAGTYVAEIDIHGRSAHIGEYWNGIDALAAGCQFVKEAYALEARLPDDTFRIVRFGTFQAGTTNNVVAERAVLTGAVRAFDEETFARIFEGFGGIAQGIDHDFCTETEIRYSEGYPPVINPPDLYAETRAKLESAGFAWHEPGEPMMQAEDFSYYQKEASGLYLHLGTGVDARLHTPDYDIDEAVLPVGLRLMQTLAG